MRGLSFVPAAVKTSAVAYKAAAGAAAYVDVAGRPYTTTIDMRVRAESAPSRVAGSLSNLERRLWSGRADVPVPSDR